MKLTNTKTNIGYSIHKHADNKKPSYFDAAERSISATVNGVAQKFVLRPNRETSNRVNFYVTTQKGDNLYLAIDNAKFWDEINALIKSGAKGAGEFTTVEKVEVAAAATTAAKPAAEVKPATQTVAKPVVTPATQVAATPVAALK